MQQNPINFLKSPTFNQFKIKFLLPFLFSFFDSLKFDKFFLAIPELWSSFSPSETQRRVIFLFVKLIRTTKREK